MEPHQRDIVLPLRQLVRYEFGAWPILTYNEEELRTLDLLSSEIQVVELLNNRAWNELGPEIENAARFGVLTWPEEAIRYYWPAILDRILELGIDEVGVDWFFSVCDDLAMQPMSPLYGEGLFCLSRYQLLLSYLVFGGIELVARSCEAVMFSRNIMLAKVVLSERSWPPLSRLSADPASLAARHSWASLMGTLAEICNAEASRDFVRMLAELVTEVGSDYQAWRKHEETLRDLRDPSAEEWRDIRHGLTRFQLLLCCGLVTSLRYGRPGPDEMPIDSGIYWTAIGDCLMGFATSLEIEARGVNE